MPLGHDIALNGAGYTVLPGSYQKRSATPGAAETRRLSLGPFGGGQRQALVTREPQGWDTPGIGPVFEGQGVEPFPNSTSFGDAMSDTPTTTLRAHGALTGNAAYVSLGRRIYKSVNFGAAWSAFTAVADLGAGYVISGLVPYQDDLLVLLSSGQDIRRLNTATNTLTLWRSGEKGVVGCVYGGQLIYAPRAANNQEELRLSGTKWNGNAETFFRYLDSPILNMALFNGQVALATRTSLYFMSGRAYPGEADDAAVTADTSKAPAWIGEPEPIMTHGQFAAADDFTFLCSYRGKLYTWLAGRVAEYDGDRQWTRMGPEGVTCFGGCVADDWLLVAIRSRTGESQLWGFNGAGWWQLAQRSSPGMVWPLPLGGAGDRDVILFRDGSASYDLYRLKWRSATVHTYASSGSWISSLIDASDPTRDKVWRAIGATFAQPQSRGNSASSDAITLSLDYSSDAGVTWQTAASLATSAATRRGFTLQSAFEATFATLPSSRHLQLRVTWSSISDWAPVLVDAWVEYSVQAQSPPRRRWELVVQAADRQPRRDGALDPRSGRQKITALWDAWEGGNPLTFQDVDEGLWDPSHLPNLALWLKADALSGLLDGDAVAAWPDASGNGEVAVQATGANQPIYRVKQQNRLPVVRFGGDDWLTIPSQLGIGGQPFSQFAVWRPGGTAQALMLWANSTGLLLTDLDNDVGISSGSALFNLNSHPFGQWHMVAGVHAGAASNLTVDGGPPVVGTAGSGFPSGNLTIGAGVGGVDRWLNGDLGEVVITRAALSATERERLEGYAAWKWDLAILLPPNHPYKSAPPVVTYHVRIAEINERVAKPSDAARWGESQVALTLVEL